MPKIRSGAQDLGPLKKQKNAPITETLFRKLKIKYIKGGTEDTRTKPSSQKPCVPQVNNLYRKEEGRGQNNKTLPLWCQLAIKIVRAKIRVESNLTVALLVVIVLSH